jgi:Ca2+/Na+ antiporter
LLTILVSFDIILIVSKLLTARQTRKEINMKRAILYTLNFIIFMAMLTFIALLDSDNYMPYMIGFILCVAWFTLFCYANNYFYHNDR